MCQTSGLGSAEARALTADQLLIFCAKVLRAAGRSIAPGHSSGTSGVININFVISGGGRHIHEVVSEFFPPFSSASVSVPTQTSADDWKVASEQDD
jgi:hypothetical protein